MTRPDLTAARELLAALDRNDGVGAMSALATVAPDLRALLAAWDEDPPEPGERYESKEHGVRVVAEHWGHDVWLVTDDPDDVCCMSPATFTAMLRSGDLRRLP